MKPHRLCAEGERAHIARQANRSCSARVGELKGRKLAGILLSINDKEPRLTAHSRHLFAVLKARAHGRHPRRKSNIVQVLFHSSTAPAWLVRLFVTWSAPLEVAHAFIHHSAQLAQPSPSTLRMPSSPCAPSLRPALVHLQPLQSR